MAKLKPKDWSPDEKTAIVLALLAGGSITELARTHGVSETTIYKWRDAFVEAGQAQLAAGRRKSSLHPVEEENRQLKEALAETVLKLELQKKLSNRQR